MPAKVPREFLERIKQVKNKRARLVLDRIVKNGSVTTEELKRMGYEHPPRARMDALDLGFPIITTRVKSSTGKSIAAYSFDRSGTLSKTRSGRSTIPKKERVALIGACGNKCQICSATHDLQVDHRVPFQVAGESLKEDDRPYMVLDGSCNRRKSWACEHCENFVKLKRVDICQTCYWANPESHTHVAMEPMRRVDLVWQGDQVLEFDAFHHKCKREKKDLAETIKNLLKLGK